MPMYVRLYKLTPKGAEAIRQVPEIVKGLVAASESMGSKPVAILATTGAYDFITVAESPNDETAAGFAAAVAEQGYMTTETMRAFTMDEFAAVLAQIP
jgi:uncharacterized protein with GYD domain